MDKIKSNINLIIFVLLIILLWKILKNNFILIGAIAYLLWESQKAGSLSFLFPNNQKTNENFDQTGTKFLDIGEPKYDLLGNRVFFHPPDYDIPRSTYSCCKR